MFTELMGQRVHVSAFGHGRHAVVGVAGAIGTSEIWQQPFELLSRDYLTIAYDHFGAGATRVPAELVTFENQVLLLEALLGAFRFERCCLAADSTMSAVAIEVAVRNPKRIDSLALVAAGMSRLRNRSTEDFVSRLRSSFEETIERFVAICIPESNSEHLRDWLKDIIRRTGGERAAALLESFYDVDISARLPLIAMPTAVIQGELDVLPASTPEAARAMAALIPACSLEVLHGVGHVPTLERPDEVARVIQQLIEGS